MSDTNVERPKDFTQVCIWPGTLVGTDRIAEFEGFMAHHFSGTRVKYLEEIQTKPDRENGKVVKESGGRNDVFFAVHKDDIGKFAVPRLSMGIRWIEDVLANEKHRTPRYSIYPKRVTEYRTW